MIDPVYPVIPAQAFGRDSDRAGIVLGVKTGPLIPPPLKSHSPTASVTTLFVVALLLFSVNWAPFLGQWDSFDYIKQIVNHYLSDLGVGRPVFIAYNVVLWEVMRPLLRLEPRHAQVVVIIGIILSGACGVLVFFRLSRLMLKARASRMAAVALLLSPLYVMYSALIMTEIPMLVTAVTAAVLLWNAEPRRTSLRDLGGGLLFGMAVGIREQALTLGAVYIWILLIRRNNNSSRVRSLVLFAFSALAAIAAPVLPIYLQDPEAFAIRMRIWLHAIPMEGFHFWRNVEASLLFLLAICPGAWLGLIVAGGCCWFRKIKYRATNASSSENSATAGTSIRQELEGKLVPAMGILAGLVLPIAALWRDADVQIHPRYALVALPASLILCSGLYHRWLPSRRATVGWTILQLAVFGIAQIVMQPYRQAQYEKKAYVQVVRDSVPGPALLIPGSYSPMLDYYRGLGERPDWQILWSGWGWNAKSSRETIHNAWENGLPVFLCDGPKGWFHFEEEWLDLYFILKDCRKEVVAPGLFRVFPGQ